MFSNASPRTVYRYLCAEGFLARFGSHIHDLFPAAPGSFPNAAHIFISISFYYFINTRVMAASRCDSLKKPAEVGPCSADSREFQLLRAAALLHDPHTHLTVLTLYDIIYRIMSWVGQHYVFLCECLNS